MAGHIYFSLLNPAIAIIFAAMFLLLWQRWQSQQHLAWLASAFGFSAIGFVFYDVTPFANDMANRLLSNFAFVSAVLAACVAGLRRSHIALPTGAFAALLIPACSVFGWFLVVSPSVDARIVTVGLLFGGLTLITALKLIQAGPGSTADRLLVIAAFIGAFLSLARPVLAIVGVLDPADGPSFRESSYWLSLQAFSPILIGTVAILFLAAMTMDTFDQLKAEANHDYLTGLLNRRGFEAAISAATNQSGSRQSALLVADIDDFKQINDRFGHKAGDHVIAAVARALSSHGKAKFAARMGGEEFALYYDHGDHAKLQSHADAIRAAVRQMVVTGLPASHKLTLSIGLHSNRDGETLSEMLIEADRALYKAKADGKDRSVISLLSFSPLAQPA